MPDLADHVAAYVQRRTDDYRNRMRRRDRRLFHIGVVEIADAIDVECNAVLTALRKAEDRGLVRLLGDPVHAVMLDETGG